MSRRAAVEQLRLGNKSWRELRIATRRREIENNAALRCGPRFPLPPRSRQFDPGSDQPPSGLIEDLAFFASHRFRFTIHDFDIERASPPLKKRAYNAAVAAH